MTSVMFEVEMGFLSNCSIVNGLFLLAQFPDEPLSYKIKSRHIQYCILSNHPSGPLTVTPEPTL